MNPPLHPSEGRNLQPLIQTKLLSSERGEVTAIELSKRDPTGAFLPLSVRHERGEGWGEGKVNKDGPPLPDPLLPSEGKRGRRATVTRFFRFLNSMGVGGEVGSCPLRNFFWDVRLPMNRKDGVPGVCAFGGWKAAVPGSGSVRMAWK